MATDDEQVIIETDPRTRVSLARLGVRPGKRYLGRVEEDGTVVLEPVVLVTEAEARLLANPVLVGQLRDAVAHPERSVPRRKRPTPTRTASAS